MIHVDSIVKKQNKDINDYPYNLKLIKEFDSLEFPSEVTIIIGDNGSGKTTFMNLMANALNLNRINFPNQFENKKTEKLKLSSHDFKIIYQLIQPKGFFFQGEEFINYLNYINYTITSCYEEIRRIDQEYKNKSDFAKNQAKMPYLETIADLKNLYDTSLLERSHGEGFIDFFKSRLRSKQLYLLDEPETPLSFQNLLLMIALIKESVLNECQFIISTHSPVLMAYPNATIYEIEDDKFICKKYEELDIISNLKYFLNNKEAYLKHL